VPPIPPKPMITYRTTTPPSREHLLLAAWPRHAQCRPTDPHLTQRCGPIGVGGNCRTHQEHGLRCHVRVSRSRQDGDRCGACPIDVPALLGDFYLTAPETDADLGRAE
jgi:hypothetical protein